MLRVFEAFSGVGSQRMALRNIGIDHEVVAIAEIDKHALNSYKAIHGDCPNLGDISLLSVDEMPDHDLFTYSFPCQDISVCGRQDGFTEGSGTRSSLLWECRRVIEGKKPKFLLLENVKNLIGKKNIADFQLWLDWLETQGYTNYWDVLNAKEFDLPQSRERVFVVSILGEHTPYQFPIGQLTEKCIADIMETDVEDKYFLSQEIQDRYIEKPKGQNIVGTTAPEFRSIGQRDLVYTPNGIMGTLVATDYKQPKQIIVDGNLNQPQWIEQSRRIYNKEGLAPTIPARSGSMDITPKVNGKRIRKLTPLECWRLMGFTDEDFYKAKEVCSDTQLYKQAGNSIAVTVLEGIFSQMFKEVN